MKNRLKILTLSFLITNFATAQSYTISGYVSEIKNGETLISASVFDGKSGKGSVTNSYGFYSLTLPKGFVNIAYSYVGFGAQHRQFELSKDTVVNISLGEAIELSELIVTSNHTELGVKGSQMSAIDVPIAQIKAVPALFGETDVIKALQLLPGVKAGSEGAAGMYVRGGGPDENLMMLDGVPVYNANHAFGFFSVFNADAIKNVTLYKGSFPARFGGRLSSVIDIRMKDGDAKNYHGNISVGLISSKLNVEGPIIKDKTSFNFSARRTYIDLLLMPIISVVGATQGVNTSQSIFFYDLNMKVNHKISEKDRLYLSAYMGDDVMGMKLKMGDNYDADGNKTNYNQSLGWNWGNIVTALRWNHIVSNKLFMNTTASYTRYRFDVGVGSEEVRTSKNGVKSTDYQKIGFNSGIHDIGFKADFDYTPNTMHDIKFGAAYTYHSFIPGVSWAQSKVTLDGTTLKMDTTIGDQNIYSNELSLYFEDNVSITDYLKANVGLHYSAFLVQGKPYQSVQPRLGLRLLASDRLSFKAGFANMNQYIHLLSNSSISLPTDLWVPVTKRIAPMISNQYSAGAFYSFPNIVELSVEGYYKSMDNIIEYKDGASFLGSSTGWEDKVNMGRGWAYGIEFMAQRTVGKTTGWVGYTWSKSERLFDRPGQEINYGKAFPAKYDRRHDISIVVSHKLSEKIDFSATWIYSTGNCGTLALQEYSGISQSQNIMGGYVFYNPSVSYISNRNNFRFPDSHRLDLGINFHKQKKHGLRTWNFSVYNAYNHQNPFMVYKSYGSSIMGVDSYTSSGPQLKQLSIFPIMISASYSYKF